MRLQYLQQLGWRYVFVEKKKKKKKTTLSRAMKYLGKLRQLTKWLIVVPILLISYYMMQSLKMTIWLIAFP